MTDRILIIDFGSQVTQLIARRVRECGVYSEIVPFNRAAEALATRTPKAIILSGGPASTTDIGSPRAPQAVFEAGIPARLSGSAGNFLCNALMYHALGACAGRDPAPRCGFIHVPYLPQQVAGLIADTREEARLELHQRGDLPSMSLDTMVEAIRIAIATALEAKA